MARVKRRTLKKRGNKRMTRRQRKLSRKTMLRKRVGGGETIKIKEILSKETVNNHTNNENHEVYFIPDPVFSVFSTRVETNQTRYDGIKINGLIKFKAGYDNRPFFTDSNGYDYSYKDEDKNKITRIERVHLQGVGKDKITSGTLVIGKPLIT